MNQRVFRLMLPRAVTSATPHGQALTKKSSSIFSIARGNPVHGPARCIVYETIDELFLVYAEKNGKEFMKSTIALEQLPNLATDRELQKFMRKSAVTLYRWRAKGLLPFHRLGGEVRYTQEDVREFLDRCKQNAVAGA